MELNKYAIIQLKDKQFFVKEGSKIKSVELNEDDKVNTLLLKDDKKLTIGEPTIKKGGVKLEILDNEKIKTDVRRFKSKSRYRRNKSHSQVFTFLKVTEVSGNLKESEIVQLTESKERTKQKVKPQKKKDSKKESLSSLNLSTRAENALKAANVTVNDLKKMSQEELENVEGIGTKTAKEILKKLK